MSKIKQITVIVGQGVEHYYKVGSSTVEEIINSSLEYPDHIHSLYDIKNSDGNKIATIENCPVLVEFF